MDEPWEQQQKTKRKSIYPVCPHRAFDLEALSEKWYAILWLTDKTQVELILFNFIFFKYWTRLDKSWRKKTKIKKKKKKNQQMLEKNIFHYWLENGEKKKQQLLVLSDQLPKTLTYWLQSYLN